MNRTAATIALSALLLACSAAPADLFTLTPSDPDLGDLDHYRAYTWGIDTPWAPADEEAVSATLSFENIRNWTTEQNVLYIHLLDDAPLGARSLADYWGGDYFAGDGIVLTIYTDLPATAQDLTYHFTGDQLATLNTYAADGRFALGLDPDCHFYNDGVKLEVGTGLSVVPEPATAALLAIGAIGLLARRRRRAVA